MSLKRFTALCLSLVILLATVTVSCSTGSAGVVSHGQTKTKQMRKNKNGYSSRYGYKSRPVKKPYIIKNKSK